MAHGTDRLFAALHELLVSAAENAPEVAQALWASLGVRSAEANADQNPVELVWGALESFVSAGPEAWTQLVDRLDAWVRTALDADARAHDPLFMAIDRVLRELGQLAADALSDPQGGERLDALVMPWLERVSAACVDAVVGKR